MVFEVTLSRVQRGKGTCFAPWGGWPRGHHCGVGCPELMGVLGHVCRLLSCPATKPSECWRSAWMPHSRLRRTGKPWRCHQGRSHGAPRESPATRAERTSQPAPRARAAGRRPVRRFPSPALIPWAAPAPSIPASEGTAGSEPGGRAAPIGAGRLTPRSGAPPGLGISKNGEGNFSGLMGESVLHWGQPSSTCCNREDVFRRGALLGSSVIPAAT